MDARTVLVSPDISKIVIIMDGGDELHSDDEERRADYNLAKVHVQVKSFCKFFEYEDRTIKVVLAYYI